MCVCVSEFVYDSVVAAMVRVLGRVASGCRAAAPLMMPVMPGISVYSMITCHRCYACTEATYARATVFIFIFLSKDLKTQQR